MSARSWHSLETWLPWMLGVLLVASLVHQVIARREQAIKEAHAASTSHMMEEVTREVRRIRDRCACPAEPDRFLPPQGQDPPRTLTPLMRSLLDQKE